MKQEGIENNSNTDEAILAFISGIRNTPVAMKLTRNICDLRSLWLLAKMSADVKKNI